MLKIKTFAQNNKKALLIIIIGIVLLAASFAYYYYKNNTLSGIYTRLPVVKNVCGLQLPDNLQVEASNALDTPKNLPLYQALANISQLEDFSIPLAKLGFSKDNPSHSPTGDYAWYVWKNYSYIAELHKDLNHLRYNSFLDDADYAARATQINLSFTNETEVINQAWSFIENNKLNTLVTLDKNSAQVTPYQLHNNTYTQSPSFGEGDIFHVEFTQSLQGYPLFLGRADRWPVVIRVFKNREIIGAELIPVKFAEKESVKLKSAQIADKQIVGGQGIITTDYLPNRRSQCPKDITLTQSKIAYVYNPDYSDTVIPSYAYIGTGSIDNAEIKVTGIIEAEETNVPRQDRLVQKLLGLTPYSHESFTIFYNKNTTSFTISTVNLWQSTKLSKEKTLAWFKNNGLNPNLSIFVWEGF
ncbi:hypothetical protein KKB83_03070 [Patescibacteria group bacterium]|nr:hypothetical protein [Patescibacteria group bacterium]